jgi:hypothetical protein
MLLLLLVGHLHVITYRALPTPMHRYSLPLHHLERLPFNQHITNMLPISHPFIYVVPHSWN